MVEGGRLWLRGDGFPQPESTADLVTIGGVSARMAFAAPDRMAVVVPPGLDGGETPVKVAWLPGATLYARVGTLLATGLHQVDNPVFGADGNLYVTYSGTRGQEATVSIFRITKQRRARAVRARPRQSHLDGDRSRRSAVCVVTIRRPRLSGLRRWPLRSDGVGSRRGVRPGVRRGWLAVCRRSRRQRVARSIHAGARKRSRIIPSSIAAFHLAMSPDGDLYVVGADAGLVRFGEADRSARHACTR